MADEEVLGRFDYTKGLVDGMPLSSMFTEKVEKAKDKRRRRKAQEAFMASMSDSIGAALPRDEGDGRMGDGLSLALGSAAQREYVRDRMGMDRFEQVRAELAMDGFGTKSDLEAPGADEFHEERYEELSGQDADLAEREADLGELRGKAQSRSQAYRVSKEVASEGFLAEARGRADMTASQLDDEFVEKDLSEILSDAVTDTSEQDLSEAEHLTDFVLDSFSK